MYEDGARLGGVVVAAGGALALTGVNIAIYMVVAAVLIIGGFVTLRIAAHRRSDAGS